MCVDNDRESCKNSRINHDAVWWQTRMDLSGHRRHLANTTEHLCLVVMLVVTTIIAATCFENWKTQSDIEKLTTSVSANTNGPRAAANQAVDHCAVCRAGCHVWTTGNSGQSMQIAPGQSTVVAICHQQRANKCCLFILHWVIPDGPWQNFFKVQSLGQSSWGKIPI